MWLRWLFLLALGMLLPSRAVEVQARVLAEKSFGGKGWQQTERATPVLLPVSFAGIYRGSIAFDLRRTGDIPASERETVFALLDGAGAMVLMLQVSWTSAADQGNPRLYFRGPGNGEEYRRDAPGLWGPDVELDQPVAPEAWIHVELSWDDTARTYAVSVDGKQQLRRSGRYEPERLFSPEMLQKVNANLEREGKPKIFDAKPLGAFLSGVASVKLGSANRRRRTPPPPGEGGAPARRLPYFRNALLENFVIAGEGIPKAAPEIASVDHDAGRVAGFSGKLVAGDTFHVTMEGTPGATGTFDLAHYPDVGGTLTLDWRGWGVYLEDKTFFDEGEVNLRDVEGYLVYASTAPFDPAAPNMEPVAELEAGVQSYTFEYPEVDTPYYLAAVARMRDGTTRTVIAPIAGLPLTETAPGSYAGSYLTGWLDRYPRAVLVGRLEHGDLRTALAAAKPLTIEPGLTIAVATEPSELKADEISQAHVTVTVTDANGDPVSGHKMKLLLATTSQYTGVVGGGDFADQVGGSISNDRWLETDLFGRLEFTYVAGFAAKTAIIVVRDMLSNSTGSGWVKTYISATAQLQLEPAEPTAAMDAGYEITVTSSDEWLTADGRSQARITARVTLNNQPVEGHAVDFSVSSGTGSIRTVKDTTDKNGAARALYTAGKKIGIVVVTATDTTVGISGTVAIELRSDAPAKIAIKLDPDRLPADGRSSADLSVLVTDINDNPNDNVEVEYLITGGGGSLRDDKLTTDKNGESATQYTAGRSAGTVTFEITVRSTTPTEAELAKAEALAVAVTDYDFF